MTKKNPHKEENIELAKQKKKRCATCNRVKRLGLFYSRGKRRGRSLHCKACEQKKRKPALDARRDEHYRTTYGITLQEYNRLLDAQDGRCRICNGKSRRNLAVDHNHTSLNVRGLLCQRCNGILAHFRDSIDTLDNAMDYLRRDGSEVKTILGKTDIRVPERES